MENKSYFFFSLFFLIKLTLSQQSIKVYYTESIQIPVNEFVSTKNKVSNLKNQDSIIIKFDFVLRDSDSLSSYTLIEKLNNSQNLTSTEKVKKIFESSYKGRQYKDIKNGIAYKEQNFFGKKYLVSDSIKTFNWKIARDEIYTNGYKTRKAKGKYYDSIDVEAYFVPTIPSKSGPNIFFGLPGLIVKVVYTISNYRIIINATEIKFYKKKRKIKLPKDLEVLSSAELYALIKKQTKTFDDLNSGRIDDND